MAGLLLFLLVFSLGAVEPRGAASAPVSFVALPGGSAVADARRVSPALMRTGALLLPAVGEAQRIGTDVEISVTGPIARTVVVQRFQLPTGDATDGTYVFPLPGKASVDSLRAEAGDRVIEGRIQPVGEAVQSIAGARPTDLPEREADRPRANVFSVPLRGLPAGEVVTVRIVYQQTIRRDGAVRSLRFPLISTPRTSVLSGHEAAGTGTDRKEHADGARRGVRPLETIRPTLAAADPLSGALGPLSLRVRLNPGFALSDIRSLNHEITVERQDSGAAVIAIADGEALGREDFRLTWTSRATALPQVSAFRERLGDHDYVLALITPPPLHLTRPEIAREIIFVVDASRSMSGEAIQRVKGSLALALDRLGPSDRFNIVRFADEVKVVFEAPRPATGEAVAIAKELVSGLDARGTTEMLPALKRALEDETPGDVDRQRQIVVFSDGAVNNETEVFTSIAAERGRARVFTVGIGPTANGLFLQRAAEIGRGTYTEIGAGHDGLMRMWSLLRRLEQPAVTELRVTWAAGVRPEVSPDPVPDLYAGEPIVLAARLTSLKGDMTVSGSFRGKPWKAQLRLQDAPYGDGVAKFWARRKIAALDARRYAGQDMRSVDDAIAAVALEHGLVSRSTRLVALELEGSHRHGIAAASESSAPAQQVLTDIGRTVAPLDRASPAKPSDAYRLASGRQATGPLGRSGESADTPRAPMLTTRTVMMMVMGLFFAAMCAVTLGFWRHLRRVYASSPRRTIGRRI